LSLGETLKLLSPELILLFTGLVVLCVDFIWRDEAPSGGKKTLWVPALALAGLGAALLATILLWGTPETVVLNMMAVDPFALFFKVLATATVMLVVLAAVPYLQGRTPYRGEFYSLLVFAALAISLATSGIDLILIYLGMECLITGAESIQWLAVASIVLLLAGFGFKIVLAPFHQWAPDTYEGAPTPVTAFLSVGSKAAGFAILIRVFLTALPAFRWDIGWMAFLMALSIVSMVLGNVIALRQTNIKRMLAYSSISQAGFIIIGVICLTLDVGSAFLGVNGTLFYLFAYLFTNLAAFTAVIALESATGSAEIADYRGLVKRAPIMAGVMLIALLSLAGIPGTGGFLGKLLVFGAAIQMNLPQTVALAVVGVLTSVVAAFYYLNVVRYMFFEPAEEGAESLAVPVGVRVGLVVTAVGILVVGIYPQPFLEFATKSIQMAGTLF
jgi:NADH-quinone oxidoreductase subunit N